MGKIILSEIEAQATEVVNSLVQGSLNRWIDTRFDDTGHDLHSYWSDCDLKKKEFFQRRIQVFSQTLRYVRVTEVRERSAIYPEGTERTYPYEASSAVCVQLGNQSYPDIIKVQVAFDKLDQAEESLIWGKWILSQGLAIMCLEHPQRKFVNQIVLGGHALVPE